MKLGKEHLSKTLAVCALFLFCFSSCAVFNTDPPTPTFVEDTTPSWDGREQNSGIIDYTEDGILVTKNAAGRYAWLTKEYGGAHTPPIEEGMGLSEKDGKFYMTEAAMVEFMVLNANYKSGIDPKYLKRDNTK